MGGNSPSSLRRRSRAKRKKFEDALLTWGWTRRMSLRDWPADEAELLLSVAMSYLDRPALSTSTMDAVAWALQELCRLGAAPAMVGLPFFGRFSSAGGVHASRRLALFRMVCHHAFSQFPRPSRHCLGCDFPLLNCLNKAVSRSTLVHLFRAYEEYLELPMVQKAIRYFRELDDYEQHRVASLSKFVVGSTCNRHRKILTTVKGQILDDVMRLLKSYREVPTLQRLSALAVLRCVGGDRSRTRDCDLTHPVMELLDPPAPPYPEVRESQLVDPFLTEGRPAPARTSEETVQMVFLVLPRVFERLRRMESQYERARQRRGVPSRALKNPVIARWVSRFDI